VGLLTPRRSPLERAISVHLAKGNKGHEGSLAASRNRSSAALAAGLHLIPKLVVRVRFPSPAPHDKGPGQGHALGWASAPSRRISDRRPIRGLLAMIHR
jgi:hypothetical protein